MSDLPRSKDARSATALEFVHLVRERPLSENSLWREKCAFLYRQEVDFTEMQRTFVNATHPARSSSIRTKVLRGFGRLRLGAALPSEDKWRGYLGGCLPVHRVPTGVSAVTAIPLTATGGFDTPTVAPGRRSEPRPSPRAHT